MSSVLLLGDVCCSIFINLKIGIYWLCYRCLCCCAERSWPSICHMLLGMSSRPRSCLSTALQRCSVPSQVQPYQQCLQPNKQLMFQQKNCLCSQLQQLSNLFMSECYFHRQHWLLSLSQGSVRTKAKRVPAAILSASFRALTVCALLCGISWCGPCNLEMLLITRVENVDA